MLIAQLHGRILERIRRPAMGLLVLAGSGLTSGVAAQGTPFAMVYRRGADTIGVERVTMQGATLTGDIVLRGLPRMEWRTTPGATGAVTSIAIRAWRDASADAPLLQRAEITLVGDSVRAEMTNPAGATTTQRFRSGPHAFLLVNASGAMVNLALARALATPSPVDTFPVFLTSGGQTVPSVFRTWGDSASWDVAGQVTVMSVRSGHVQEVYLAQQNLRMTRVEGRALNTLTLGAPDYNAPAGAPYSAERVAIASRGGFTLVGTLTMPRDARFPVPVVVTISGSGPQDRDEYIPLVPGFRPFRQFADTLGRHGIGVLRMDDRGTGESGGSFRGSTSADFANDIRDAIRWLRARPDVDGRRVVLLGHSEGGLIAPMIAADDPTLAGIVLLAGPSRNGLEIVRFQQRYAITHDTSLSTPARRDSAIAAAARELDRMARTDKWMQFFFSYDPLATARRVKVPVLIAQGGSDQQVTADQAGELAAAIRAAGNTDVTVRVFPERNHLFLPDVTGNPANYTTLTSGHIGADVVGPVLDWIVAHTRR
ncbi:MAG: alpha/beta fold hydrolase [Gemmatimonadaceae bacterium]|nr:alpha/beta fold hydrolase [Gemmatimonadaceae bacterium]